MRRLSLALSIVVAVICSPASAQENVPSWTLREELRIGAVDGPDAFQYIGRVVVSPRSGRIFATDGSEGIVALDPEGQRIGTIGRRGAGPGEFENLSHIYWMDGAIVALDNTHRTLTRFDETGQLIDVPVSPATQTSSLASVGPVAPLSDGYFLGAAVDHVVGDPIIRVRTRLFRIGGVGGDSILDEFSDSERVSYRDTQIWIAIPMRPISHYAVHPYGESVVVAHQSIPDRDSQGTFRVRKLDGAGSLLFSRTYNYRPQPVPAGLLDDFLERMELHRSGLSPREVKRYIEPHMPGFELPITGVAVATDGSIWLRREDYDREQVRWSVLSERGDPVAQLLLPAGLRVRHITEDALFAVDEDEWGVNYLVKYAIERGS